MAFKDSGVSERFSDATKKFSGMNTSEAKTESIHKNIDGKMNTVSGNDPVELASNGDYSSNDILNNTGNVGNANISPQVANLQMAQPFRQSEHEVLSDYGHLIQSDTLQEQTPHTTSSNAKKDSTIVDELLLRGSYHNYSHKEKPISSEFVDRTSLFKADESKGGTQEPTPYIYYDHKKKNDTVLPDAETVKGHDKMAYREMFTNSAGGAKFEAHYTKRGKLKSDVILSSGKERTDNKGFRNKSVQFVDKVGKADELLSPEENEAVASVFDAETEIVLEHATDRIFEKENRFRKVEKKAKSERKEIEKEIKISKKEAKNETHTPFKNSNSVFVDKKDCFESMERKFKNDRSSNTESTIFAASTVPTATKLPEIRNDRRKKEQTVSENSKENLLQRRENLQYTSVKKQEVPRENNGNTPVQNSDTGNRNVRSVESYFTEGPKKNDTTQTSERFMSKEERLEQAKSKEKAAKSNKNKELRKAAATTAVAKMLNAKKNMQNQLGDMSGQGTGDLIKDGSGGLVQTFANALKQGVAHMFKAIGGAIWKCIGSVLGTLSAPILIFLVCFLLIVSMISALGSSIAADSDSGVEYDLDVTGDGFVYESLTDEEIEDIIAALYENYDDMTLEQEMVLRYSLSKVGCAYDQAYHGNLTVDIFDCSSLAYRSYLQAGIDISNGGGYSAADECFNMVQTDKITDGDLKPGDLLFYGGSDNGRYLGVYHVAIYVGTINGVDKMVEARGTSWGVVYCDVRTNNVVKIARPYE